MMDLGLATHYLPSEWLLKAKKEYIENGLINTLNYYPEMTSEIARKSKFYRRYISGELFKK